MSSGYKKSHTKNDLDEWKNLSIHRAVAMMYVDNPDNKPFVNHIDENKLNNHYTNLEWVTASENSLHSRLLKLQPLKFGDNATNRKLNSEIVKEIRESTEKGNLLALKYNISKATISHIKNNKTWFTKLN